jgi:hypothetical protein
MIWTEVVGAYYICFVEQRETMNKPIMKFGLRAANLSWDLPNVKQELAPSTGS